MYLGGYGFVAPGLAFAVGLRDYGEIPEQYTPSMLDVEIVLFGFRNFTIELVAEKCAFCISSYTLPESTIHSTDVPFPRGLIVRDSSR